MNKILSIIAVFLLTLSANAQKVIFEGQAPSLKGENKLNVEVDFSEMKIDKKNVSDWLEFRQLQQPDYDAKKELEDELKPTILEQLCYGLNSTLKRAKAYAVIGAQTNYTVVVKPMSVEKKGSNVNKCSVVDKNGTTLIVFEVKGKGGTFGSMANLFGDGYKDTGKNLGKILADYIKK